MVVVTLLFVTYAIVDNDSPELSPAASTSELQENHATLASPDAEAEHPMLEIDEQEDKNPNQASIVFPDGDSIDVVFHEAPPRPGPQYRQGNLAEQYPALVEKAEGGDALAAMALYDRLSTCADFPFRTQEKLDDVMKKVNLWQPYEVTDRWGHTRIENVRPETAGWLASAFGACEGVTDDIASEAIAWLWHSSDLGNVIAKSQLGLALGDRDMSLQLLKEAFDEGFYDAARSLGQFLANCGLSGCGADHIYSVTDSDMSLGYGYLFIYTSLLEADPSFSSRRAIQYFQDELRKRGNQMSQRQIDDALTKAKQALSNNSNCCYRAFSDQH